MRAALSSSPTRIGFPISTTHGLIGAMLVTTASLHGMPVSTTHVSVGALLGMGTVTRQAKWKTVIPVIASWVITLPVAAILAGFLYLLAA